MPIVTPQVPEGLVDLMKGLAREVIREKPENIYEFAANYFENLLLKRDGCMDKGYERFTAYQKLMAGTERYVLPSYIHLNCVRAQRRTVENAKESATSAGSADTRNMAVDNQKYINAIYVIQRYVRRYLIAKRAKNKARTENAAITRSSSESTKNAHSAAAIIQRSMRKFFILKLQKSEEEHKKKTHNASQDNNIPEAGSNTSSSTVQMKADLSEATNVDAMLPSNMQTVTSLHEQDSRAEAKTISRHLEANSTEFENNRSNNSEIQSSKPPSIDIKPQTEADKAVERPKVEISEESLNRTENKDTTSTSTINIGNLKSENSIGLICSQNLHEKAIEIDNSENISKQLEIITTQSASCSSSCSSKQTVIDLSQMDLSEPYSQTGTALSIQHISERIDPNTDEAKKHRMYEIFYQEDKDDAEFSDSLNESTIERDSLENTISKYTDCEENDNDNYTYDDHDDEDDNHDNDSEDSDSIDGRSSRKTYRVLKISPLDEAPCIGGDNLTETRQTSAETKPVTYNYEVVRRRQRRKKEKSSTAFIIPIKNSTKMSEKNSNGSKEVKTIPRKVGEKLMADVRFSPRSTKDFRLKFSPTDTHGDFCEEDKYFKPEKRKLDVKSKINQQNEIEKSGVTTSSAVASNDIIGKIQKSNIRGHLSKVDETNMRKNVSHIIRKSKNRVIHFKSKIPLRIEQKNSKFSSHKITDVAKPEGAEEEFDDGSLNNKQQTGEVNKAIQKPLPTPPTPSYECKELLGRVDLTKAQMDQKLDNKQEQEMNEANEKAEHQSEREENNLKCDQNEVQIETMKVNRETSGASKLAELKSDESVLQLSLRDLNEADQNLKLDLMEKAENEEIFQNCENELEKTVTGTSDLVVASENKIESEPDKERTNEIVTRNCRTDPNGNSFLNTNDTLTLTEIAPTFDNQIYLDDSLRTIPELNESAESIAVEMPKKEIQSRISFETDPDSDCEPRTNQWNCSKEAEENAFSDDYVNEKDEENEKCSIKSKSMSEALEQSQDSREENFDNVDLKEKIGENEMKGKKKTQLEFSTRSGMGYETGEDLEKFREQIVESSELGKPAEKVENGLEKILRDTKNDLKKNSPVGNSNESAEIVGEEKRSLNVESNFNLLEIQQHFSPTTETEAHQGDGNENGLKNILKVAKDVLKIKLDGLSANIPTNTQVEVGSLTEAHASESQISLNEKENDSSRRNNIGSDSTELLQKVGAKQEKEILILHKFDPNDGKDYSCTEQKNDPEKLENSSSKNKEFIRTSSTGDRTKDFENQEKEIFSSLRENQLSQPDSKDNSDLKIMANSKSFYLETNKEATTQLDELSDLIPATAQIKFNSEKLESNQKDCNQKWSIDARTQSRAKADDLCQSQAAIATQKVYSIRSQIINKIEKSSTDERPKFEEPNKIENISQNNLVDLENMEKFGSNKNENTFLASDQSSDCKVKIEDHIATDQIGIIGNNQEKNLDEKNFRLPQVENEISELSQKTIQFDQDHNHERQLETTLPDKYDDGLEGSPLTKANVCETTATLIVDAQQCRNNLSSLAFDAPIIVDSVPASDLQTKLTAPSPNINSETPAPVAVKFICTSSLFGDQLKNFSNPKPSDEIVLATATIEDEEQNNGKLEKDRLEVESTERNIKTNDCAENDDYTLKSEDSNDLKKNSNETEDDDDRKEKDKTQSKTVMDDETSTKNDTDQNKNLLSEVENEDPRLGEKQSELKNDAANFESDISNELANCADEVKVNTISLFPEIDINDTSSRNNSKLQVDENMKTDSNQNEKIDMSIESEIDSSKKSSCLLNDKIKVVEELGPNSKIEDSFEQNNCEKQNGKHLCELKRIDCKDDDDMAANILNSCRDKVEIGDTLNEKQVENVPANAGELSSGESAKIEKTGEGGEEEIISKTQETDILGSLTSTEKSSIGLECVRPENEQNKETIDETPSTAILENLEEHYSENNKMIGRMEKDTKSIEELSTESNETVEIIAILSDFINDEGKDLNSEVPYEVLEEVCVKKTFSLTTDSEIDDSETEATKIENSSIEIKVQSCANAITDPLDAMTEKLRETEKMVQRMQQRRASETKVNTCGVDNVELLTEQNSNQIFEEPGIMPMCELQSPNSTEEEDNNEVIDHKNKSESESSVQSDDQKMQPEMKVNADASNPKTLLKSVTIDEFVKYIDPSENGTTTTTTSGSSLCLDEDTSENIRQKMMAYSLSEADSDFFEATTDQKLAQKLNAAHDDSDIDTALGKSQLALSETSTDTDTTTASAATRIQAGARGFLTRRRLRHASYGTKSLSMQENSSFGNDAINESLERLIEENAARKIQKAFRHYHREMGVQSSPSTYAVNSVEQKGKNDGKSSDCTQQQQVRAKTTEERASAGNKDIHGEEKCLSSFEGNLAARRQTLQRGDALRNDSVHEDEEADVKKHNNSEVSIIKTTSPSTSAPVQIDAANSSSSTSSSSSSSAIACNSKKIGNMTWFGLRQNSMPVQIDSEVFRVIPKHMRKRIRSAETEKKKRVLKY